jgi:hypothetical protein
MTMPEDITDTVQQPVTDLVIIKNVHDFQWNFADIKQSLNSHIKNYVGLVVTEENLKEMETAQKEIASIRTKVDGFRKAVKKKMEEPYKVFEGEIKELLQLIEKAESPLKDQTLKYERERILTKEKELGDFAAKTSVNMGIRNSYFNFIVKSQWTNRTAKDSTSRKEIVAMLEAMLDNQRRDDEAKEIAKQRVGLIEGQCRAHSAGLKTPVMPSDVNHLLVSVALSEIPGIILCECQKRADMEAKAAEPAPVMRNHFVSNEFIDDLGFDGNYQPPLPSTEILKPTSFILPPMPPVSRAMPPMPPKQDLYDVILKLPGITVQQAGAVKQSFINIGVTYEIVKQEKTVDWGEF